jgi:tetratricopeptide (TPR) repeat protein
MSDENFHNESDLIEDRAHLADAQTVDGGIAISPSKSKETSPKHGVSVNNQDSEEHKGERRFEEESKEKTKHDESDTNESIKSQLKSQLTPPNIKKQPAQQYLDMAKGLKDKAKPFFENKQYFEALKIYEYALKQLGPDNISELDKECEEAIMLQNGLLVNMSLCYSHLQNHATALKLAQEVLKVEPRNLKALFRVAVELKFLGYAYKAFLVIQNCKSMSLRLHPGEPLDPGVEKEYNFLHDVVKPFVSESSRQRKIYSQRMLGVTDLAEELYPEAEKNETSSQNLWKYVLYAIPAGAIGMLTAQYLIKKQFTKQMSMGIGCATSLTYWSIFNIENTWLKAFLGSVPLCVGVFAHYFKVL